MHLATNRLHPILLCLLAFALYAQTLPYGYVLDDYLFITGNNFTKQGLSGIPSIWTNDVFTGVYGESLNRYRPLPATLFAIEYQLFGPNPFVGHLVSILLYAVTGLLIRRIVLRLAPGGGGWTALAAAALFLAHPLHTEVVANIKSRDEILALLLSLGALHYSLDGGLRRTAIAGTLLFFAMTAKESAITFLAVIPLARWYFSGAPAGVAAVTAAGLAVPAAAYVLMRQSFVGFGDNPAQATDVMFNPYLLAGTGEKWASIVANAGRYLKLLVWPHPLAFDYSYNQIPYSRWSEAAPLLSLAVTGGLLIAALRGMKSRSLLSFCILYYAITFSVASNIFINTGTPLAERFLYAPSVGFCLAAALLAGRMAPRRAVVRNATVAVLTAAGFAMTVNRNPAWKDNLTLYETDAETVPNSALVRMFHGIELRNRYRSSGERSYLDKAVAELTAAAQINPRFHHAWQNLGQAYQDAGNHEAALRCFGNVLKMHPTHINAHYGMGYSLASGRGDADAALPYLERLVYEFHSTEPDHISGLGIVFGMKGRHRDAENILRKGLETHPENANLHFNLGITMHNLGEEEKARQSYERAFALDPELRKKTGQ